MSDSDPPRVDEMKDLLADSRWLQGLARRLVADSGLAEDLVQEAYVVALENRARVRGSFASFLAGVIRKLALSSRRGAIRRARREAAAGRPEDGGSGDVVAAIARVEMSKRLAERLLALREPYRSALLLRFVEDLSQREIARRLAVPVATVNSRITRGLFLLREDLDRDANGDRSEWVLTLAPLALPSTGFPILTTGVLIMNTTQRLALFSAAIVAVAFTACFVLSPQHGQEGPTQAPSSPAITVASVPSTPTDPAATTGELVVERSPIDANSKVPGAPIKVHVFRDSDHLPLPGIPVYGVDDRSMAKSRNRLASSEIRAGLLTSFHEVLDRTLSNTLCVYTDERGDAKIELLSHGSVAAFHGELYGSAMIRSGASEVDITLAPLTYVTVDVRDERGAPVAGVPVLLLRSDSSIAGARAPRSPIIALRSDAAGRVQLPVLTHGGRILNNVGVDLIAQLAIPLANPVERKVRATGDSVTLVVPATMQLVAHIHSASGDADDIPDGTLVLIGPPDAENELNAPFIGARVKDGVAVFPRVGPGLDLVAVVRREGDPIAAPERFTSPAPLGTRGEVHLTLDPRPIVAIKGRLLQKDGTTPWAYCRLIARFNADRSELIMTGQDGSFEYVCRLPKEIGAVARLRFQEEETLVQGEFAFDPVVANETGHVDLGDRILERRVAAAGIVRDSAGRPLGGLRVERVKRREGGAKDEFDADRTIGAATTDEEGRFEMVGPPPDSDRWISVSRESWPYLCDPVPYREATDLEIVVPTKVALIGHVVVDEGLPCERLHAALWNESRGERPAAGIPGWTPVSIARDGILRCEDLDPGHYTLAIGSSMLDDDPILLTHLDVKVAKPSDPRLDPIDLRSRLGVLDLDVRDESGNALQAFAVARYADKSSCQLGNTSRPFIVRRDKALTKVTVSAEGFASESLEALADGKGTIRVVLKRDVVVELEWPDPSALPAPPVAISAALTEVGKSNGRSTSSSDDPTFDANGIVRIRVPRAGSYYLSVTVTRVDGNVAHWAFVTDREKCPVVTVPPAGKEGIPRIRIPLDADAATKALARLN